MQGIDTLALWFFSFGFASTATTIVSGALAERTYLRAHLCFAVFMAAWIYPTASYWVWSHDGWLSIRRAVPLLSSCGFLDIAGSGVVHVTGGSAATMAALFAGPRIGRFDSSGMPPCSRPVTSK